MAEVYGPMGRDVTSVVELFKASLSPQLFELDPLLPGTSWREEVRDKQIHVHCVLKGMVAEYRAKINKVASKREGQLPRYNMPYIFYVVKNFECAKQ